MKTQQLRNAKKFKKLLSVIIFHWFDLSWSIDQSFSLYSFFYLKEPFGWKRKVARCGLPTCVKQMRAKSDGWRPWIGLKLMEWFLLPCGTEEGKKNPSNMVFWHRSNTKSFRTFLISFAQRHTGVVLLLFCSCLVINYLSANGSKTLAVLWKA